MFSCEFCKIYKNTFLTEHLWTTASEWSNAPCFNPLIVWNNPFEVDDLFAEKPVGWFAQAETENFPRVKF